MIRQNNNSPLLIKIESNLCFQDLKDCCYIKVVNTVETPVYFQLFSSNPDNYSISSTRGVVLPGQSTQVNVRIKVFDSISEFNYNNNKITILCVRKPQVQPQKYSLVGEHSRNIQRIDLGVEVDIVGFAKVPEDVCYRLKKSLKVHKHTSHSKSTPEQLNFLMSLCQKLGKMHQTSENNYFLFVTYKQIVNIQPEVYLYFDASQKLQSVFSISYFSTLMGRAPPEAKQPIKTSNLKRTNSIVNDFPITEMKCFEHTVVCKGGNMLFIFDARTHECRRFVHEEHFRFSLYSPYLCVVMEGKYMTFYDNFEEIQTVKIKVKKLLVRCFCKFNGNLYIAGRNCSKIAIKPTTNRRQIYVVEKFDPTKMPYVLPKYTIELPKSDNDVEELCIQNPYMVAYCRPSVYLISLKNKQTLVKFQKELMSLSLLQGRYANSLVSFMGISREGFVCKINFEKFAGVYGVEVNESNQKAKSIVQNREGWVFLGLEQSIVEYNLSKQKILEQHRICNSQKGQKLLYLTVNNNGQLGAIRKDHDQTYIELYKMV